MHAAAAAAAASILSVLYHFSIPKALTMPVTRPTQAVVTPAEAEAMARRLGLKFYRTCVRENLNVTEGERPTGTVC
jgi:hypothetical protein